MIFFCSGWWTDWIIGSYFDFFLSGSCSTKRPFLFYFLVKILPKFLGKFLSFCCVILSSFLNFWCIFNSRKQYLFSANMYSHCLKIHKRLVLAVQLFLNFGWWYDITNNKLFYFIPIYFFDHNKALQRWRTIKEILKSIILCCCCGCSQKIS